MLASSQMVKVADFLRWQTLFYFFLRLLDESEQTDRPTDNIDVCCLVLYVYVTSAFVCFQMRKSCRDGEALVTAWCLRRVFLSKCPIFLFLATIS